jgi:hypothetical protein
MRNFIPILLLLTGCNGVQLSRDAGAPLGDAGPFPGDAAPDAALVDAWTGEDGGTDTGTDASLETPDASTDSSALEVDGGTIADACDEVTGAYLDTGCAPELAWCTPAWSSGAPAARVNACLDAIAFGFSEASGPADMGSRCLRAARAMNECQS